jgi:hypothetical protein
MRNAKMTAVSVAATSPRRMAMSREWIDGRRIYKRGLKRGMILGAASLAAVEFAVWFFYWVVVG